MSRDQHQFCRHLLSVVRREADDNQRRESREWGVLNSGTRHRPYYVVEGDKGKIIWEGGACCCAEARHNALVRVLDTAAKDTCAAMLKGDLRDAEVMNDFASARIKVIREETTPIEWATWRNFYVRRHAGEIIRGIGAA